MTSPPVLALDSVTKRFGDAAAVDDVSLAFEEGEFFALLGPSGCGKTTLLRLLAGFAAPDSGRILLDGADVTAMRANRRPLNLMFQSYALFPHLNVRRNVAYGLEMERLPRAEVRRRTEEILERTALGDAADRMPSQLSGGQQQRVALARALVKRPRLLLLDEPLAALDRKLREEMQIELKRLQAELGVTFVVVTHDQEEALVMADRLALMNAGRIVQHGTPRDVYESPATRFAATFIGVSNLFEGELADGGLVAGRHGTLRVPAGGATRGRAALAVRPERMTLEAAEPGDGRNGVRGTVSAVAYHGSDLNVHVRVGGPESAVVVRADSAGSAPRWRAGQSVWCVWNPGEGRLLTE